MSCNLRTHKRHSQIRIEGGRIKTRQVEAEFVRDVADVVVTIVDFDQLRDPCKIRKRTPRVVATGEARPSDKVLEDGVVASLAAQIPVGGLCEAVFDDILHSPEL